MERFRVTEYRCINDSGWVEIDDIITVVGKNGSGKTAVLHALWKFSSYRDNPYNLDREWLRGRRKEKSANKVVITVEFVFDDSEQEQLASIDETSKAITHVVINRMNSGARLWSFVPQDPPDEHTIQCSLTCRDD